MKTIFQPPASRYDRPQRALRSAAWLAAALLALAGCGGGSDDPDQRTPSAKTIASTQRTLDGTSVAPPTSGVPTAANIAAIQAAFDGSTTDGAGTIVQNQTALDATSTF